MSEDETKLVDATGDYCQVVRDGEPVAEPSWRSARVVLTDRRLRLPGSDGDRSLPHDRVELTEFPEGLPDGFSADDATALRVGGHVFLVDASVDDFDREYCRAALDAEVILVNHPAVVGGVVQDTEWSKLRARNPGERSPVVRERLHSSSARSRRVP
ncbi:MAG: CheF family chemotaxis protein [Haloarculaceae archaeon]